MTEEKLKIKIPTGGEVKELRAECGSFIHVDIIMNTEIELKRVTVIQELKNIEK